MNTKYFAYQILGVGIIWLGMLFFFSKLDDYGRTIFYVVTSWLLFLSILLIKNIMRDRKQGNKSDTSNKE